MKTFVTDKTPLSPLVKLDKNNDKYEISGKSALEDAYKFYKPVLEWFTEYFNNPNEKTEITLFFEYLNSASSVQIGKLMDILEKNNDKSKITVNWIYEYGDDTMKETGKELKSLFDIKFNFTERKK